MRKMKRSGKIKVDGKEYDLKDLDSGGGWGKPDNGFYGHMTHGSMQKNEDSVDCIGDGFHDSSVPKTPKTDKFVSKERLNF